MNRLLRLEKLILLLPLFLVAVVALYRGLIRSDDLTVWSCGGNYESLKAYIHAFEKEEKVHVRYTAAPVTFLLDRALVTKCPPDVVVGRGGPGWLALKDAERLAAGPVFFALDPLAIAVPAGNPAGIRELADLGRCGVRIAQCPEAMRPKAKVPALLMSAVSEIYEPGLVERWENNFVTGPWCGRDYLDLLVRGKADAAIAPGSLLSYPSYAGRLERIPIPARYILSMKQGRPSIPQCAAALRTGRVERRQQLAQHFVDGLCRDEHWLHRHGYLALTDPEAVELGDLLSINRPRDIAGWQCHLAERLAAYGLLTEARRRYLKVYYTFGPSHYSARALCRSGVLSTALGQDGTAYWDWARVLREFPPPGPVEYDSPALVSVTQAAHVERQSYGYWIRSAERCLANAKEPVGTMGPAETDPVLLRFFPVRITEGTPPKNGTREFGLGLHLLAAGDYVSATRDLLKVVTLNYPSRHAADAEYLLGVCADARGLSQVARSQWQRVLSVYPGTFAARQAAARLDEMTGREVTENRTAFAEMDSGAERLATHPGRGMVYGIRLSEHGLPLYAFKEMMKVACGVYGGHDCEAELRCRAGAYLAALGNPDGAVLQWSLCLDAAEPDSVWQVEAANALQNLGKVISAGGSVAPLPGVPPGTFGQRLLLAEELRRSGVYEDGQIIMEYLKALTVAKPAKPGAGTGLLAMAHFRLGECLEHEHLDVAAREEWQAAADSFPDTPWGIKAAKRLERGGPAKPDAGTATQEGPCRNPD